MSSSNLPPLPDILIDVPPTTKFKRGDVVRLNSGGPAMTVTVASEGEDDTAECQWFGNENFLSECFFEDCLTLVTP